MTFQDDYTYMLRPQLHCFRLSSLKSCSECTFELSILKSESRGFCLAQCPNVLNRNSGIIVKRLYKLLSYLRDVLAQIGLTKA